MVKLVYNLISYGQEHNHPRLSDFLLKLRLYTSTIQKI